MYAHVDFAGLGSYVDVSSLWAWVVCKCNYVYAYMHAWTCHLVFFFSNGSMQARVKEDRNVKKRTETKRKEEKNRKEIKRNTHEISAATTFFAFLFYSILYVWCACMWVYRVLELEVWVHAKFMHWNQKVKMEKGRKLCLSCCFLVGKRYWAARWKKWKEAGVFWCLRRNDSLLHFWIRSWALGIDGWVKFIYVD